MVKIMRKAEQEFNEVVGCGIKPFARKPQHADRVDCLGFWLLERDQLQIAKWGTTQKSQALGLPLALVKRYRLE